MWKRLSWTPSERRFRRAPHHNFLVKHEKPSLRRLGGWTFFDRKLDIINHLNLFHITELWFWSLGSAHEARLPLPRGGPLWRWDGLIKFRLEPSLSELWGQKQHKGMVYKFIFFQPRWWWTKCAAPQKAQDVQDWIFAGRDKSSYSHLPNDFEDWALRNSKFSW